MKTVSFELAQKLESIGFYAYTQNAYATKAGIEYLPLLTNSVLTTTIGKLINDYHYCNINDDDLEHFINAPSYAQVLEWLRARDIDIMIERNFSVAKSYRYVIVVNGDFYSLIHQNSVPNRDYYEAANDAINYIIDKNLLYKKDNI